MKTTDNAILKFLVKNIDPKFFSIFTKKTFIISFLFCFAFGIFFIYEETRNCRLKGELKFNPIYTPPKILENEFFLIRSVSKKFPSIQWYKNSFEVIGTLEKKDGKTFCENTIIQFSEHLEEEYVSIVRNSMAVYDEINFDFDDIYSQDLETIQNITIIKRQRERDRNIALRQIERLIANPDKYTLEWRDITPVNFKNIAKQIVLFCIYSLIFALFFTTAIDLIFFIRSYNK